MVDEGVGLDAPLFSTTRKVEEHDEHGNVETSCCFCCCFSFCVVVVLFLLSVLFSN
jgi:hypothetical protein